MNKHKGKIVLLFGALVLILLALAGWFFLSPVLKSNSAFLKVTTEGTESEVYLNGREVGNTPYLGENLESGNSSLKIVGRVGDKEVVFVREIKLFPRAVTAVNYEFGPNELFSSGDIRLFENGTGLSISTKPAGASIMLDGEEVGKSPVTLTPNEGVHKLQISHEGYVTRELEVNTETGLTLVLEVFLAAAPVDDPKEIDSGKINVYDLSTSNEVLIKNYGAWAEGVFFFEEKTNHSFDALVDPTGKMYYKDKEGWDARVKDGKEVSIGYLGNIEETRISDKADSIIDQIKTDYAAIEAAKKPRVQITSTPTGTLNVRSGPGLSNPILTKVKPGEKYELLDESNGWYKINASSTEGWVSGQYAKKL